VLWSKTGEPARDYLHGQRGLLDETIRAFGLGYNPNDATFDDPKRWGLDGKKIWCPRGIVIPGRRNGTIWYIKVRRPLPGDDLAMAIGRVERLTGTKFSGPRGGRKCIFGADRLQGLPVLLLVEGEFDAMLAWQAGHDLCDVASLGAARNRVNTLAAVDMAKAWVILAVRDDDPTGAKGLAYMRQVSGRVVLVESPDHDVTDYWRAGGSVRQWVASLVAGQMEALLEMAYQRRNDDLFTRWLEIYNRSLKEMASLSPHTCVDHAFR